MNGKVATPSNNVNFMVILACLGGDIGVTHYGYGGRLTDDF